MKNMEKELNYRSKMLHPINETFSEEEWTVLKPIKLSSGMNWHDFIILAARCYIKHKEE